jgi:RimJ/RimL family protein N-acetyltransferase
MVAETERLRLRRFRREDAAALDRWAANREFQRFLGDPRPAEQSLRRYNDHWERHGFGICAVELKETGELVGRSGVAFHRIWPTDPEVGWAIDPAWWGRGIATEAGAACVEWAFGALGYERVVSISVPDNLASRRVMAKLGFRVLEVMPRSPWGELWIHALDRPRPDRPQPDRPRRSG